MLRMMLVMVVAMVVIVVVRTWPSCQIADSWGRYLLAFLLRSPLSSYFSKPYSLHYSFTLPPPVYISCFLYDDLSFLSLVYLFFTPLHVSFSVSLFLLHIHTQSLTIYHIIFSATCLFILSLHIRFSLSFPPLSYAFIILHPPLAGFSLCSILSSLPLPSSLLQSCENAAFGDIPHSFKGLVTSRLFL